MNINEAIELVKNTSYSVPINSSVKYLREDTVINILNQIDTQPKVVVPEFVAEWYDYAKKQIFSLRQALEHWSMSEELEKWFQYSFNQNTFARAWLDGYEVEKEQLYTVELFNGQPLVEVNNVLYFSSDLVAPNACVSKDKLELAGFGWVFDCNGVKVVEVDE